MKKTQQGEFSKDNAQLFYDSETGKISAGAPVTIDWECTSVTFKCAVCGEEIKTQPVMTMPVSVVVDQNNNSVYINVGGTRPWIPPPAAPALPWCPQWMAATGTICRTTRLTQAR